MSFLNRYAKAALRVSAAIVLACGTLAAQEDAIVLENLGPNVNSPFDEVGPVISPDGKTLYFDRSNHPDNIGDDDIWVSTLQRDGTWSAAVNIGPPLNNRYNNFVSSVMPDGTLLLGNVYFPDGRMGPGVSMVRKARNGWGTPQGLKIKDYYSTSQAANYRLANDGKTLLMSIQRQDSYGEMDIYVSFLEKNGEWSAPMNIGSDINTRGYDRTPFLAADGVTLYFSSDGHGGFGSSDIFFSRRLDSTWRKWSPPQNLGKPINTEGWDGFFTLPAAGDYAYLVSSQGSIGAVDIFRVKLTESMRPRTAVLISGRVLDAKTRQPIAGEIVYEKERTASESGTARSDPNGAYTITVPAGGAYRFNVEAEGYRPAQGRIDLAGITEYREITRDFLLTPLKRPRATSSTALGNVYFETASAELDPAAIQELNRVMEYLRQNPDARLTVAGHTDNVGSVSNNRQLSNSRVASVIKYLEEQGVDTRRFISRGYGESRPASSNSSAKGRQDNRRVEFRIQN